jgi:lambda family phage tail tape measure protein
MTLDVSTLGIAVDSTQVGRAAADLDKLTAAGGRSESSAQRMSATWGRMAQQFEALRASQERQERQLAMLNSSVGALSSAMGQAERVTAAAERAAEDHARAMQSEATAARAIDAASTSAAASLNAQARAAGGAKASQEAFTMAVGAFAAVAATAFVVKKVYDMADALSQASINAQRLTTTLNFSSGGNGARELEYVTTLANKMGLELSSTGRAYASFAAASRGTTLEGQKTRDIFEAVSKASAVLGLSAEDTSGVLLALQQMVSKGTVQSEELRGQLGERLPGAFQIAARAMGVTTGELGKMLEQGQVVASDFLPKFARALDENMGAAAEGAADRLDASANRIANAWERMKQKLGDSGVSQTIASEREAIARDMTAVTEALDGAKQSGGSMLGQLGAAAGVAAGRTGFATLNLAANSVNGAINALTGGVFGLRTDLTLLPDVFKTNSERSTSLASDLARAEAKLKDLRAEGANNSPSIYLRGIYWDTKRVVDGLREAQGLMKALATGAGGGRGSINPQTVGQMNAAQEEWDGKVKKYLGEDARQSKPEIRAEEIQKAKDRNKLLVEEAKARGDVAAATRLEAALKTEVANIEDRHKDKKEPKPKEHQDSAAEKMLQNLRESEQVSRTALATTEQLTGAEKRRAEFVQQMADLKDKKILTSEQKSLQNNEAAILRQLDVNVSLEKQIKAQEEAEKVEKRRLDNLRQMGDRFEAVRISMQSAEATRVEGYQRELAGFGLGDRQQEEGRAQQQIAREFERYKREANIAAAKNGGLDTQEYRDQVFEIERQLDLALGANRRYYLERDKLRNESSFGESRALANYLDGAANVAGQTEQLYVNAFGRMEDALTVFAQTGKLSFSGLANSIIADLARMEAKALLSSVMKGSGGSGGSLLGGLLGNIFGGSSNAAGGAVTSGVSGWGAIETTALAPMGAWDAGGYTGNGGKYDVAGVVHRGEYVVNADAVERLPRSFLDSLNKGYATGGMGGEAPLPMVMPSSGGGASVGASQSTPPLVFAPVTNVQIDGKADMSAAIVTFQRLIDDNNKRYTAGLQKAGVLLQ